jgi:hypothetical protein
LVAQISTSEDDDPDAPLLTESEKLDRKVAPVEPELFLVKTAPITSSLCGTIKHLKARCGRGFSVRGLGLWAVNNFLTYHLSHLLARVLPLPYMPARGIAAVLTSTLLCRLSLTWTHIVISENSDQWWGRRIPSCKNWLKIAPATALAAAAKQLTIGLPIIAFELFDLPRFLDNTNLIGEIDEHARRVVGMQLIAVVGIALGTAVLVLVPATVTLTRVQASLLPETDETVVPFDRSFGGKVVPEILGGSGKIGLLDAWKTFDWASRLRLVRVYLRMALIQFGVFVAFVGIFAIEMRYILPDNLWFMGGGETTLESPN